MPELCTVRIRPLVVVSEMACDCRNGVEMVVHLWGWESRSLGRTDVSVVLELVGGWAKPVTHLLIPGPMSIPTNLSICYPGYMAVSWVHLFFEFWCVFSTSVCAMGRAVQTSLETLSVWRLRPHQRHSKHKLASNFSIIQRTIERHM